MKIKLIAISAAFLFSGCATTKSGFNLLNPTTWTSGSEGRAVAKAKAQKSASEDAVLHDAQRSAHEAQEALKAAGDSRPVKVARDANNRTVTQLDQVVGPLTIDESNEIREQNELLLSENEQLRAQGKKLLAAQLVIETKNSTKFAKYSEVLDIRNNQLEEGFARENAMANKYRNLMFAVWGLGALAAVMLGLYVYAKVALGGIPKAMAGGLSVLRARGVIPHSDEPNVFDSFLNRIEQAQIAKHA